ncbi:hypothetical protein [Pseudoxanthobacter sp.]|uniref:hypothetical protein n=1 Tax=Pseudoxanthobacter sp. TaxID=1925742 RepID=UPI002FE41F8D
MSLSLSARMEALGPLSEAHREAVLPTVEAWAGRAGRLMQMSETVLEPGTSPITAFVASEPPRR